MSEIIYETWHPRESSLVLVEHARQICREYAYDGYDLTLRQLYYQFVARDLIPNSQRSYKNLGAVVNKARMAGLLDWSYIVDRTRNLRQQPAWATPGEIIHSAANSFKLDRWKDQDYRIEVWIEKDALTGVIESVCHTLDVPFFSCRGYTSQSELWRAAQRQLRYERDEQQGIVIHLGDHDPSGIDMTRDINDRMLKFGASPWIERIALNMDQVEQYTPPPNPTKLTDSRANTYIRDYGYDSWELDALEPSVINQLIEDKVFEYRDAEIYEETMRKENDIVEGLKQLASTPWTNIKEFLS